jgi:hypothetical protein
MRLLIFISLFFSMIYADDLFDKKVKTQCAYLIEKKGNHDEITDSFLRGVIVGVRASAHEGEFPIEWENNYIYKLGCIGALNNRMTDSFYQDFILSVLGSKKNQ